MTQITRTSQLTGVTRTIDMDVTQSALDAWEDGLLIQDVMGHLSASDREFIKTGITEEEWDAAFKGHED